MRRFRYVTPDHSSNCREAESEQILNMLNFPAIFFLIAMGAAAIGFSGVATGGAETAKDLSVIFLIGSICSLPARWRSQD